MRCRRSDGRGGREINPRPARMHAEAGEQRCRGKRASLRPHAGTTDRVIESAGEMFSLVVKRSVQLLPGWSSERVCTHIVLLG